VRIKGREFSSDLKIDTIDNPTLARILVSYQKPLEIQEGELVELIGVRRNKNRTYIECRFISPEQKASRQMLASIEMSEAPKGQRSVRDILNIMHDMPSTLNDIGISARTVEAARAAKVAAWKVMLQDWRDVGPQTMLWTADRDEHARELATQQQDFNENPFSDEHLQIRWAMMAKSELQPYFLFLQEQIKDITSSSKTSPSAIHMCIAIHTQAWSSLRVEDLRSNWAVLHPNQIVARRAGCGGWTNRPCREPPERPMRPRGASGARSQAFTSAPTNLPRELVAVLFFMKSSRPSVDPGGYIAGERIPRTSLVLHPFSTEE
jgi:hypothetical protein